MSGSRTPAYAAGGDGSRTVNPYADGSRTVNPYAGGTSYGGSGASGGVRLFPYLFQTQLTEPIYSVPQPGTPPQHPHHTPRIHSPTAADVPQPTSPPTAPHEPPVVPQTTLTTTTPTPLTALTMPLPQVRTSPPLPRPLRIPRMATATWAPRPPRSEGRRRPNFRGMRLRRLEGSRRRLGGVVRRMWTMDRGMRRGRRVRRFFCWTGKEDNEWQRSFFEGIFLICFAMI